MGRAFTGFYPPQAADLMRSIPLPVPLRGAQRDPGHLVPVGGAGRIAGRDRPHFALLPFVLVLLGFVVLHAISNLSNDYFGARRGMIPTIAPAAIHRASDPSGAVSSRLLVGGLVGLAAIALAIGVYFVDCAAGRRGARDRRRAPPLGLRCRPARAQGARAGRAGRLHRVGSAHGRRRLLRDHGRFSAAALIGSVPYGLGVMSILVGKHIDQRTFDERSTSAPCRCSWARAHPARSIARR